MKSIANSIKDYNNLQTENIRNVCNLLEEIIKKYLLNSNSKIWHGSPVWFLENNPIVAYSVRKNGKISLMFFSGQSFKEEKLIPEGKFKAAEIFYSDIKDIDEEFLKRCLEKAIKIQWDYKNIIKNKGVLNRI